MTHILKIKPAVTETLRYKIKELLDENGYTYHTGCTNPLGDTYNEIYFSQQSVKLKEKKSMGNTDVNGAKKNVKDIVVFGDGDLFQLLSKASSEDEGWMKSTKAMETPFGVVLQVTTQQKNPDGSYAIAEAVTNVPGVRIQSNAAGRKLVAI